MTFHGATDTYDRLALVRPDHLPDEQWAAIAAETARVESAFDRGDLPQVIGSLKDLLESIARCVKELSGEPDLKADFPQVLQGAHEILRTQRGHHLAHSTRHSKLATSAMTMAKTLAEVRNEVGTGHGRAGLPTISHDELTLIVDASLVWARWALRRLGPYCHGRPDSIVADLETDIWRKGALASRLAVVDLTDERTAKVVGVAVGRRAAGDTFNVMIEGVEDPASDDDVEAWPDAYRWAVASGLLFDASGRSTVTARRLLAALELVKPAVESDPDPADQPWQDLVDRLARVPRCLGADDFRIAELHAFVALLTEQNSRMEPGARLVVDGLLLGDGT